MIKHRYEVNGIEMFTGSLFYGVCVSDDIIKVIQLFRDEKCSVWNIERKEQVNANEEIGIKSLNIGGKYSEMNKTFDEILDEIDKSITSDELFRNGEIVEDSNGYEAYYSDAPGGMYNRVRIIKLNGKYYVYKEKVIINNDCSEKSECIAFYELK